MGVWHLRNHDLDPRKEMARHEHLGRELRARRAAMKNRHNAITRDLIRRAIAHEEEAAALKRELE